MPIFHLISRHRALTSQILGALVILAVLFSSMSMAAPGDTLVAPKWLGITELHGGVNLRWFRVQGAVQYIIQRRVGDSSEYKAMSRVTNPVFDDAKTTPGQTYFYRIVPVDNKGIVGPASVERFYKVLQPEPESLAPPVWSANHVRPDGIALTWQHGNPDHVLAYNLYRKRPDDSTFSLVSSLLDPNYLDRNVSRDSIYEYAVTALDKQLRESDFSSILEVSDTFKSVKSRESDYFASIETLEEVVTKTELSRFYSWETYNFVSPVDVDYWKGEGRLYVSDTGTGKITVLNLRGEILQQLGGSIGELDHLERLLGIAVSSNGDVYATDAYKGEIVVFSSNGLLNRRISLGDEVEKYFGNDLKIKYPWFRFGLVDVAIGVDGSILVVDNGSSWIYELNNKDQIVNVISEKGYNPDRLQFPTFLNVTNQGKVIVSDTMNSRVQIFGSDGEHLIQIGELGLGIGQFLRPKGVAVDNNDYIYVADSQQNVIQVFDKTGRFLSLLGDEKGLPIDLGSPNGMVFVGAGQLAICEKISRRIQVRNVRIGK